MKKLFISVFFLIIGLHCFSQNTRVLQDFDKIPMGMKQFEAEGYMSNISEYDSNKRNNYDYEGYTWIQYNNSKDDSIILLCFHNSVLYLKRLVIKYPINQLQNCKSEFNNLKTYINEKNKVLGKSEGAITNKAYGGEIGYGFTYYMDKSTKTHRTKSADYNAILDFKHDNEKLKATIIGYSLQYSVTDLSKTSLDSKTGFSSVQVN